MRLVEAKVKAERSMGVMSEALTREEMLSVAPYLGPHVIGGSFLKGEGFANPLLVTPAHARAAKRLGARIIENAEVRAIERDADGRFTVTTARGVIRARRVVASAGAAHSRTADARLLDRVKALSVNVTTAKTYGSTFDLIFAMARAAAGIRSRLRLSAEQVRLRALMPAWVAEMIQVDIAATQFDRFKSRQEVLNILRLTGVEPSFYLDTPSTGTDQGFADETASALDDFPTVAQWAVFIEGTFLHLDGGVLELGIVRDSTLNTTNDYQVFGETFENVARIGPEQAALWVTSTICPTGEFPDLTTALSC
jgi:hypothetical protein